MHTILNSIRLQVEVLSQHGYKEEAAKLFSLINEIEGDEVNRRLGNLMNAQPAKIEYINIMNNKNRKNSLTGAEMGI
jgi:flagellar motor switch protein FliG